MPTVACAQGVGGILGNHLCRQPAHPGSTLSEDFMGSLEESLLSQEPAHPSDGAATRCGELQSKGFKVGFLDSKSGCPAGSLSNLHQVIYCVSASVFSVK